MPLRRPEDPISYLAGFFSAKAKAHQAAKASAPCSHIRAARESVPASQEEVSSERNIKAVEEESTAGCNPTKTERQEKNVTPTENGGAPTEMDPRSLLTGPGAQIQQWINNLALMESRTIHKRGVGKRGLGNDYTDIASASPPHHLDPRTAAAFHGARVADGRSHCQVSVSAGLRDDDMIQESPKGGGQEEDFDKEDSLAAGGPDDQFDPVQLWR